MIARADCCSAVLWKTIHAASLLVIASCSAPASEADDDGVQPYGAYTPPSSGSNATVATGSSPANGGGVPAATGTSSNEQTGSSGAIGLTPPQSGSSNAGSNTGAGGAGMTGSNTGAGGTSAAAGSAGSTAMPPADGNQQPPAQNPPAQQPPQQQPPAQQPPQQQPPAQQPPTEPAPSGNCGSAFFCDDFESVANGASPTAALWSIINSFGLADSSPAVSVSNANARSGNQALRVTAAQTRNGIQASVPQASYHVRAFIQLDSTPLGPIFIGLGNDQNSEMRFRIQGQSFATINSTQGDAVRPANANGGGCPDCIPLVANEWMCVEMFVDSAARTTTLSIDGEQAAVAGPDVFTAQPASPNVFLGSWGLQGGSTGVWIDDVAVGPDPIGCN